MGDLVLGSVTKVNRNYCVYIPREFREKLNIKVDTEFNIILLNNEIILRPVLK